MVLRSGTDRLFTTGIIICFFLKKRALALECRKAKKKVLQSRYNDSKNEITESISLYESALSVSISY